MSQSTLPTNEAVAVSHPNEGDRTQPLDPVRRAVRRSLLEDELPDFDVYRALCDVSIPVWVTDLERTDG